ncbi:MAG: hypothetical protein BGP12_12380 [Rhodospirillales bacterium 70-18]|nr:integrase arm-type DNA-binding domain-containing protein [Rhodospirillales bacterium]OJY72327.1 MAG: hypothetical protein BGP12_12380 [Rhodospirillales bacterium 70-18]
MPRKAAGLTALQVRTAKPGRYGDGNGLYLLVRSKEARFWLFRYTPAGGKMREMGLGRAGSGDDCVSLADAREKAAGLHGLVRAGVDPLAQREADAAAGKAAAQDAAVKAISFKDASARYIAAHEPSWANPKHRQQWTNTLATYADPHFGDVPVSGVGTAHVLAALEPIWTAKPETASRVRGRVEAVLDYAKARGWREGENPAAWKGHLSMTLPARAKVAAVEHHPALPWQQVGAFLTALRSRASIAARALEFGILTAARSGEVMGARWGEIDLAERVWTVPAARMKAGREHRVPLSGAALAVLDGMAKLRRTDSPDGFVFPGAAPGKGLSVMALDMAVRRMNKTDKPDALPPWRGAGGRAVVPHGFRSTFRDWAAETTAYPNEVVEMALAHAVGDKVEAAYRRGDLFDKRRRLMDEWAGFCERSRKVQGDNVAVLRAG